MLRLNYGIWLVWFNIYNNVDSATDRYGQNILLVEKNVIAK